jgi:hypothetical protein
MVIHKEGMNPMPDQRLQRRNGVYYYRRRVPLDLVEKIGKKVVQFSLHTTDFKEAKKLRTLRDLEWDAKFAACSQSAAGPTQCRRRLHNRSPRLNWSS